MSSNKKPKTMYQKQDSFSRFSVNNIVFLTEIYHISYFIKDNLELFIIHTWVIGDLTDFLIF
jgi:hypothetical protein